MSTPPGNFRMPFQAQMAKLAPEHQTIIKTLWNNITDLQDSIPLLKSQIDAKANATTSTASTTNTNTSSQTVIVSGGTIGMVSDQTGLTAYTSQQSDYGSFVLLGDTSPIAVTLNTAGTSPGIQLPWYAIFINTDTGIVTFTPATGTISYPNNPAAASMPVSEGQAAIIVFDGTNFTAEIICVPPQDTPAISHEWIDAYSSATGIFTQTQPAFTDISGIAATDQIGTGTPLAGEYVDGGTGAWTALPAIPVLPSASIWITAQVASSVTNVLVASANITRLWPLAPPVSMIANSIGLYVGTPDNSTNLYDCGIYSASGVLLGHIGATPGTVYCPSSGLITVPFLASITLTGGTQYLLGFTTNVSSSPLRVGMWTNQMTMFNGLQPASGSATTGGVLNPNITPPSRSWVVGGIPNVVLFN